jgi:hypothetical protein
MAAHPRPNAGLAEDTSVISTRAKFLSSYNDNVSTPECWLHHAAPMCLVAPPFEGEVIPAVIFLA